MKAKWQRKRRWEMVADENVVSFTNGLTDVFDARSRLLPSGGWWRYLWSKVFGGLFDVEVTNPRRKIAVAVTVHDGSNPAPGDVVRFFEQVIWPRRDRITEFTFKSYPVPLASPKEEIERYLVRVLNEG